MKNFSHNPVAFALLLFLVTGFCSCLQSRQESGKEKNVALQFTRDDFVVKRGVNISQGGFGIVDREGKPYEDLIGVLMED